MFLVLEYQSKGCLLKYVSEKKVFAENQLRVIMEQLLLTLDYMHRRRIVHRDIKLDNILINEVEENDELHIKIADFGLADIINSGSGLLYISCGTPSYIAPEVLRGTGYN